MNKNNIRKSFTSVGDELNKDYSLAQLARQVEELNHLSLLICEKFPDLRGNCHCGAIDYPNDLLVIYVKDSVTFHQVNRRMDQIEDVLIESGCRYSNFKVKMRPESQKVKRSSKKILSSEQQAMLVKFAHAIGREDLLKSLDESPSLGDEINQWEVKL